MLELYINYEGGGKVAHAHQIGPIDTISLVPGSTWPLRSKRDVIYTAPQSCARKYSPSVYRFLAKCVAHSTVEWLFTTSLYKIEYNIDVQQRQCDTKPKVETLISLYNSKQEVILFIKIFKDWLI